MINDQEFEYRTVLLYEHLDCKRKEVTRNNEVCQALREMVLHENNIRRIVLEEILRDFDRYLPELKSKYLPELKSK